MARALHERGWVANHDGNISARGEPGEFLATPTATSKRLIKGEDILIVDLAGKVRAGRHKLFGEWHLHKAVYQARPDCRAVLHAHPPTACGYAVAHKALPRPAIAEMVVSLGPDIPLVPFALPKSDKQDELLRKAMETADVVLLAGHGVLAVGDDLEQAYLRLELVEHWARIHLVATQLGGAVAIPEGDLPRLLDARTAAGFGPAGRRPIK